MSIKCCTKKNGHTAHHKVTIASVKALLSKKHKTCAPTITDAVDSHSNMEKLSDGAALKIIALIMMSMGMAMNPMITMKRILWKDQHQFHQFAAKLIQLIAFHVKWD